MSNDITDDERAARVRAGVRSAEMQHAEQRHLTKQWSLEGQLAQGAAPEAEDEYDEAKGWRTVVQDGRVTKVAPPGWVPKAPAKGRPIQPYGGVAAMPVSDYGGPKIAPATVPDPQRVREMQEKAAREQAAIEAQSQAKRERTPEERLDDMERRMRRMEGR